MNRYLLLLLFCLGINTGYSQSSTFESQEEAIAFSEESVGLFEKYEISRLVDELTPYWPLPQNEIDAFQEKTLKYMNLLKGRYGKPLGYYHVSHKEIGEFIFRETYFIRYEHTALRLIYIFYKGKDGWIVNSFKWDDQFGEEFN